LKIEKVKTYIKTSYDRASITGENMTEKKTEFNVTKKMLTYGIVAPIVFSIMGMAIAFFTTKESPTQIKAIAIIAGTSIGLFLSITGLFIIQKIINKRIGEKKKSSI